MDIAKLGFVVDSRPLGQAGTVLDDLGRRAGRAEARVVAAGKGMGVGISGSVSKVKAALASASGALGAFGATVVAALSVRNIASAADEWSDLQSVVGAAIKDMDQAPAVMQEINRLARASYSSLQQTAAGFSANVGALRDLGYGTKGALDYTEALNNALVITATKGERAASVQNALSKAMAVGKLQADGLETILANGGRVAEALAKELGTTVSGLRGMASQGKITGDVIARSLIGSLQSLRDEAAEMPATMADGFTLIGNSFTMFVGVMDKALGLSSSIADALVFVADNFSMVAGYVTAAAIGITGMYIPAIYSAVTATGAWVASLITLKGALIATGLGAFIVLAGTLIGKFLELVQKTGSFGAALAAMGEVGKLVWQALIDSAAAIPPGLQAVWSAIKAEFFGLIAALQGAWTNFLISISKGAKSIGLDGISSRIANAAEDAGFAYDALIRKHRAAAKEAADKGKEAAGKIASAFAPVGAALEKLSSLTDTALGDGASGGNRAGSGATGGNGKSKKAGAGGKTEAQKAAEAAAEALKKLRQEHTDLQATIGMTAAQERVYQAVQSLGTGATAAQVAEIQKLVPEIDRLKEAKDRLRETADTIKEGFGTMFREAITGAKGLKQAIGDLAGKLADMFANQAFQALWNMGAGLFGGVRGGDALSNALRAAIPAFANGGVTRDGWSRINERGGELVKLPGGSTVVPHDLSKRAMAANQPAAPQDVHVTVSVDQNGNLQAFVDRRAQAVSGQAVAAYDRAMPARVQQISANPRRR